MEDYPRAFVSRARPLVIFSGLPEEQEKEGSSIPASLQNGAILETQATGLDREYGASLRTQLLSQNVDENTKSERDIKVPGILQMKIRTVGNVS